MTAKVQPLTLEPEHTAIVAIDPQNSFIHPDGHVARNGGNIEMMAATVPHIRSLVLAGRERGYRDMWTQHVWYPDDAKWTKRHKVVPHSYRWDAGPTALKGTWEAEFFDGVKDLADTSEEVIVKHRFSAFLDTRFNTVLRMLDIDTLILTGMATTHCVECTARDAYQLDYDVIVPEEAVAAMGKSGHQASLEMIDGTFGKVMPVADVHRLIEGETLDITYSSFWTDDA